MLYFSTETVSTHITKIYAFATELMYLVEGSTQNILIDTGSGFGSLKTAVANILSKHNNNAPLSVFLTHGHVDHACGAGEFTAAGIPVYMPAAAFEEFKDIREGNCFDLGGVIIEVYGCPGHTLGSIVFLIREENGESYLLTGDACNTFTFLFQEYSTSIEAYEETLAALAKKLHGRYEHVLLSHGDGKGYVGLLEDVCQVCGKIKNGTADSVPFSFMQSEGKIALDLPPGSGKGNIVYHPDRIWKKDTVIR